MNPILTILAMALVTYLPRLAGFALAGRRPSPFFLRFLRFIPITVFAALVVPALPGNAGELPIRLVTAAAASVTIWRYHNLWLGILVGMGAFWLLRLLE